MRARRRRREKIKEGTDKKLIFSCTEWNGHRLTGHHTQGVARGAEKTFLQDRGADVTRAERRRSSILKERPVFGPLTELCSNEKLP